MKQSNNQVGEKVLVLGAGQLGASVLASFDAPRDKCGPSAR